MPQSTKHPGGRPSKYSPVYANEVVEFCAQGYSLTAFAGEIGVGRETISRWCRDHEEFRVSVDRAKAKCARWWEDRARKVAAEGGPSGQATMVIFGLRNHAREDYQDHRKMELTGADGGPIKVQQIQSRVIDVDFTDITDTIAGDAAAIEDTPRRDPGLGDAAGVPTAVKTRAI